MYVSWESKRMGRRRSSWGIAIAWNKENKQVYLENLNLSFFIMNIRKKKNESEQIHIRKDKARIYVKMYMWGRCYKEAAAITVETSFLCRSFVTKVTCRSEWDRDRARKLIGDSSTSWNLSL